jgi:hypothetical protein
VNFGGPERSQDRPRIFIAPGPAEFRAIAIPSFSFEFTVIEMSAFAVLDRAARFARDGPIA